MADPLFVINTNSPQAAGLMGWHAGGDPTDPSRLFDSSILGVHGTPVYLLAYTDAIFGRDHVMRIPESGYAYSAAPVNSPPCTITGWTLVTYYKYVAGAIHFSIACAFGGTWNVIYHAVNTDGTANVATAINSTFSVTGASPFTLNTWQAWAIRFNATNSREYFYNGVNVGSPDIRDQSVAFNINLGGGNQVPPHGLDGYLDDVRVYNRALSDAEIAIVADPVQRMQLYGVTALSAGFWSH